MPNLLSKVILIAGGYGHLGSEVVKRFINQNSTVIILGRSKGKFDNFKNRLQKNRHLYFVEADLSCSKSLEDCCANLLSKFGRIDILMHFAFDLKGRNCLNVTTDEWDYSIANSLTSLHNFIRFFSANMIERKEGKIICVASIYGMISPYFELYNERSSYIIPPQYAAAKGAIIQLTKYYAGVFGPENINVNCVSPGPFPNLEIVKNKSFINDLAKKTMLRRVGKPEDLAGVFLFLASDDARYITGQNIVVDGGWTTH